MTIVQKIKNQTILKEELVLNLKTIVMVDYRQEKLNYLFGHTLPMKI